MTAVRGPFDCNLLTTEALKARCARVDADFLSTMELSLRLGRNFTPEEDRFQGPPAAIISSAVDGTLRRARFCSRSVLDD
jgi:hypothetical protein